MPEQPLREDIARAARDAQEATARAQKADPKRWERVARTQRLEQLTEILPQLPEYQRRLEKDELFEKVHECFRPAILRWQWDSGNLLLLGDTGFGKTSAATWLIRRLLREGVGAGGKAWRQARGIHWADACDLGSARRKWPLGKDEAPRIVEACEATLLIVDDLGWVRNKQRDPRDIEAVRDVLNARYKAGKPTIATAGETEDALVGQYEPAVIRRMIVSGDQPGMIVDAFKAVVS